MSTKHKPVKKPKKIHGRGKGEYYFPDGVTPVHMTPLAKWKENPLINPHDDTVIELSVNPKSEYVKLYKEFIEIEIKHIMDKNKAIKDYQLTIEDCKKIKDSLPDEHAKIKVDGKEDILYDHLFIKYFIKKEKKYKYDEDYTKDLDIYLYLNVYDSLIKKLKPHPQPISPETPVIQRKKTSSDSSSDSFRKVGEEYGVVEDLLKNNINLNKADFSIGKLIEKLCRDIENLFYTNLKMTKKDHIIVLDNIKILNYASSIYELCKVKDYLINENKMVDYFIRLFRSNPENEYTLTDYIFLEIIILLILDYDIMEPVMYEENLVRYFINNTIVKLKLFKRKSYKEIFIILQNIYENIEKLYIIYKFKFTDTNIKYIKVEEKDIIKDITSVSVKKLEKEIEEKCGNDWTDAVSLNSIEDLSYNEKKHMSYINFTTSDGTGTGTICFDTIAIYNYIIICANEGKEPDNPSARQNLKGYDIVKICDNVSKLTTNEEVLLEAKLISIKYFIKNKNDNIIEKINSLLILLKVKS
jgi:hypothetical protein